MLSLSVRHPFDSNDGVGLCNDFVNVLMWCRWREYCIGDECVYKVGEVMCAGVRVGVRGRCCFPCEVVVVKDCILFLFVIW